MRAAGRRWEMLGMRMRCRRLARAFSGAGALSVALAAGGGEAGELPEVSAHAHAPAPAAKPAPPPRDPAWELHERSDDEGWVVYKRPVAGSAFQEFRLEAEIDAPPALVAVALRQNLRDPNVAQANTEKTLLHDSDDVILVYSYIEMPLVSDRDVVTESRRLPPRPGGGQRFEWRATGGGPEPKDGVVRLRDSSGSWDFSPLPEGRTFAVYESYTDTGGAIPAWLVNRLMLDTVVDGLVALRARVDRNMARIAAGEPEGVRPR